MARPTQNTIDYFPHDCQHKQTMYILESRHGNNGYAFWFKLLELLGATPGHSLDLREEISQEFLAAKTRLEWSFCAGLLDLLSKLGAIDSFLWSQKIVWSQNFVDRLATVYNKRKRDLPKKPNFCAGNPSFGNGNDNNAGVSDTEMPQSKVKESIVNKRKDIPADFEKSADDELPFADEGDLEQIEGIKTKSKKVKAAKMPKDSKPNAWAIWIDINRELGRADPFASGKDTKAAKSILSQIQDPEKFKDILRQYLADDDRFLMQNGHSISFLSSKINKYLNQSHQQSYDDEQGCDDAIIEAIEAECWAKNPELMKRQQEEYEETIARMKREREEKAEELRKLKEELI